ncbi:MAG: hypothetical protein IJ598_08710, partial [Ruminococcus sp.]|nr:hypothetical protein [Ruminococcus sp.]
MKKHFPVVAMTAAAALLLTSLPAVSAAELPHDDIYAAVNGIDAPSVGSAADFAALDSSDEYELYIRQKEVLSVGASAASQRRYHAEFMLPDTTDEVYLTGLYADDIEEIQQSLIDSYIDGQPMNLENLHFIDAEKTKEGDNDDNLCWAASCANILTYTGWAERAGFQNEDEVFNAYIQSFTDNGGFQRNGIAWFFNGTALGTNSGLVSTKIRDYPNSGGYFNNYAFDMVCNYLNIRSATEMNVMIDLLKSGYGISPGVGISSGGVTGGGHAITLWGVVTDTSLPEDDPNHLRAVLITDSDSDMTEKTDHAKSKNIMNLYPIYLNQAGQFSFDYANDLTASFEDFTYLAPYSSSLPRERDLATMRNKVKYPDLCFDQVYLSDNRYNAEQKKLYESGTKLYLNYNVFNASDKLYRYAVSVERTLTDAQGKQVFNDTVTVANRRLDIAAVTDFYNDQFTNLPANDYQLTLKVNEKHQAMEAYYYNNTYTLNFKMRDSYLLGDCDGNGTINVNDTTAI